MVHGGRCWSTQTTGPEGNSCPPIVPAGATVRLEEERYGHRGAHGVNEDHQPGCDGTVLVCDRHLP